MGGKTRNIAIQLVLLQCCKKNSPFCFFVTRFTVALGTGTGKNLDVRVVSKYEAKLADRTVRFWQKALANGADNCFVSVSNLKTLVVVTYKELSKFTWY